MISQQALEQQEPTGVMIDGVPHDGCTGPGDIERFERKGPMEVHLNHMLTVRSFLFWHQCVGKVNTKPYVHQPPNHKPFGRLH